MLAVMIVLLSTVVWAADTAPDTDLSAAQERFADAPPCPEGAVFSKSEWESAHAELREMQEIAPANVPNLSQDYPRIDVYWVEPVDPNVSVPVDARYLVPCVEVEPGKLVTVESTSVFVRKSSTPPGDGSG